MPAVLLSLLACGTLAFTLASHRMGAQTLSADPDLVAHEWGTFTSIAGDDGQAVEWLPLTGSADLPSFVEHLENNSPKGGLRGTVRMETPILYFYGSRPMAVSVKVRFAKGTITEWYPHASRVEPSTSNGWPLQAQRGDGSIAWNSVSLEPGDASELPQDSTENHYYAARETAATPLRVRVRAVQQHEKFLFYRGVASFPPPAAATLTAEGKLRVENLGLDEIPNLILFERRGDRVGYRVTGALQNDVTLDPPELSESTIDSLGIALQQILLARGLYPDEAHAMVETWRDSWFEEGSRLFYIVSPSFVDTILPLSINPAPAQTVRVFVGRLEIVTPTSERAVEDAFATDDKVTLRKYGRFLETILTIMIGKELDPERAARLRQYLNTALMRSSYH